jgi:hypothetical protein
MLHHANRDHAVKVTLKGTIVELAELNQTVNARGNGILSRNTELLG